MEQKKQTKPDGWNKNALLVFLCIGFILRVIPIFWGIPLKPYIRSYHPDEAKVLNSILGFPEIYWTTKPFAGYGTAVQYILGIFLLPFKWLFLKSLNLGYEYFIVVSIFSRFVSILFGTGCIFLTYLTAKKIYDEKVALLSAAFLSVAFFHTLNSALITLDVSSSFILMLNFFLCFKAIESNRWRDYLILGIASGILVGIKTVLAIFFCIPFLLNFLKLYDTRTDHEKTPAQFLLPIKYLLSYVVVALITFIIFHPHIFLDIDKYIAFYMKERHDWIDRTQSMIIEMFGTWKNSTIQSIGPFIPLLAFIGAIASRGKNLRFKSMLLVFIILYCLFWRWFLLPRYIIVVSPILCIFAAAACLLFYNKNDILNKISIILAGMVFGYSLYLCISGISLRLNDTRLSAAKFIMENIPAKTTIGVSGVSEKYDWRTHSWNYPKIAFKKYRVVNFLSGPDILILNSTDFQAVLTVLNSGELRNDYVLPESHYKDWYRYSAPSPKILRFYDDLLVKNNSPYVLLKTFKRKVNAPVEFAPPEIRIYKKQ